MAMINYPYPTSFLMPVPAYPISYACNLAYNDSAWSTDNVTSHNEMELWEKLKVVADVYLNYENKSDYCFDYSDPDASGTLAADGWNVLACG